jgi:Ca-activated chloride channel family protein
MIERNWLRMVVVFAVPLAFLVSGMATSTARAQQNSFAPPRSLPQSEMQGGGGGATLELPTNPRQQGGSTSNLPRMAPQEGQALTLAPHELRQQPGYEQVTVTVTNQNGGYETGLQRDDLKLYVDGVQRPIQFFRQDQNVPVSVGIIVDTSGSMQPKIPQAQNAIAEMISRFNERDDIFLFAFSDRPYLLQPFTTNHRLVLSRLQLLHAYGETALFDTIIDGLVMVQHGRWDKKALLVVTDGMDNQSQSDVQQVVNYARRMGVLIYSIGIGDPNPSPVSIQLGPFSLGGSPYDQVDAATLHTLSTETGAKTFILKEVGDGEAIRADCASIADELQSQYTVGFVAPNAAAGGYRNLRVDVPSRPGDSVRVRKGLTVGSGMESASADSPPVP